MNYDVVKTSVINAYKNYKNNDKEFYANMDSFYKEGKDNPSVARIILQDHVRKGQEAAHQMLFDASGIPAPSFYEPMVSDARSQIYNITIQSGLRSFEAENIYKDTAYINKDNGLSSRKEFDEAWSSKYPKTGKLRERLIEDNRISMDKVTPKANWIDKISTVKTIGEYKQDYPKTFLARCALIVDGQINEDGVTPSVKNWFKRFSYKKLIKKGFNFKK